LAGGISLSFTHIPESILPTWIRIAVGPAFAITAMAKLGIPHPPAGEHAVIYASGEYGWMFYLLVLLSSIISILPAIMVNNLSEKRQYPTYWGHIPLYMKNLIRHRVGADQN
jgi:CBS-domain-containing membrane protein